MPETALSIVDLSVAVDTGNHEDIRAFFEAADVLSGNDKLLEASMEHGFQTEIIEEPPANGRRMMLTRELAKVMCNSTNTNGIGQLISRHALEFLRFGAFTHDVKMLLREAFKLDQNDGRTTFATWEHYLLVAMYGQTEQARKIRAYLIRAEQRSRVQDKVEESTGKSPRQLEAEAHLAEFPELEQSARLMDAMKQRILAEAALRRDMQGLKQRQEETDASVSELSATAQRTQALVEKVQEDVQTLRDTSRFTLFEYAENRGFIHKYGQRWLEACARDLVGFHAIHGKELHYTHIHDSRYSRVNKYLVWIMDKYVPTWLLQNFQEPLFTALGHPTRPTPPAQAGG